jgi:hypothetical protein
MAGVENKPLVAVALAPPTRALAGGALQPGCPAAMACNRAIGVALRLPRGWTAAPPGHFPFNNLALVTIIPGRQNMDLHMGIEPFGTTTARDARAAAEAGADAMTQGVTLPLTRTTMSVGGLPAVRLRGLPGAPDFGQEIVVAHGGLLYGIYTFDNSRTALTPGQRQALASLRFIPHTGPALRPYGTNALVAALYNPCLDIQRTAPTARPLAARLTVSFSSAPARGNEMVAAHVTGTGFRPGQEMVLTACWNRAIHSTYSWYHKIAHVHANRHGAFPAPTVVPTFVMYVPSGRFRSWDVRVVATDVRTGQRLAAVAVGPYAGAAGATTARG